MRTGVTPHDVAAIVQFADLPAIHVAGLTDPVSGYEKMTAHLALLESRSAARVSPKRAVIEGEEYRNLGFPFVELRNGSYTNMAALDRHQMVHKVSPVESIDRFVDGSWCCTAIFEDIMVADGDCSQVEISKNRNVARKRGAGCCVSIRLQSVEGRRRFGA